MNNEDDPYGLLTDDSYYAVFNRARYPKKLWFFTVYSRTNEICFILLMIILLLWTLQAFSVWLPSLIVLIQCELKYGICCNKNHYCRPIDSNVVEVSDKYSVSWTIIDDLNVVQKTITSCCYDTIEKARYVRNQHPLGHSYPCYVCSDCNDRGVAEAYWEIPQYKVKRDVFLYGSIVWVACVPFILFLLFMNMYLQEKSKKNYQKLTESVREVELTE